MDDAARSRTPAGTAERTAEGGLHAAWPRGRGLRVQTRRFTVRSLKVEDVTPAVHGWFLKPVFARAFPEFAVPPTPAAFAELYVTRATTTRSLLILSGEAPVGFLWVVPDRSGRVVQTHNFLGDEAWWGRGVIHEARAGLIDVLFRLGVGRVFGMPRADNAPAIRCYREQGFAEEGRLRAHYPHPDGGFADVVVFGMLASEWDHERASRLPERALRKLGTHAG